MKKDQELQNQLKAVRMRLGLSQQDLATAAGVARQTIGGIEAGTYALSMVVALKMAKALGCSVDELFWLEDDLPRLDAVPMSHLANYGGGPAVNVSLARVGDRWIASPLAGDAAFRREMIPADGTAHWDPDAGTISVQLFDQPEALAETVSIAGCTPALSLWARSAERWHPGLRIQWTHANSTAALARLAAGEVHMAGVHLVDPKTGDNNVSFVRAAMGREAAVLVNLGVWEEGLLTAPRNPKDLRRGSDLARPGVTLANRETGSGARLLLDTVLSGDGVDGAACVSGYGAIFPGHFEVAEAIRDGRADVAVSTAAVATAYGLSFVPLRSVRYDLALRKETLQVASVQKLLATLHHRWVRTQLAVLGGYDTRMTGEILDLG